ncbi:YqzL family protein [Paraclostridium bifermentans]|uniref:YqzL family protein n=1 Tax=Paraclostridium bifermentans TaxID=1490 RepID=UPI00359C8A98
MNNLCWEVFKKTGSIEAYLYLMNSTNINERDETINREIELDHDNFEHPGDSTTISEI